MDEGTERMEEGLNSPLNGDGNKNDLKKQVTIKSVEHDDRDTAEPPLVKKKTKRVATLDAFRGLTIVLMILVDDAGEAYPRIDHSPWNGCTLADFVMPFFLFIVGVAIALALKRIPKKRDAVKKIILRTIKLLFWGIILQGGYSHAPNDLEYGVNMKFIRWCGILQRIALVYCVVALIETFTTKLRPTTLGSGNLSIFTAYKWQWLGGFVAFLIYIITTFTLYVPDWSFVDRFNGDEPKRYTVICGMRGHLGPACNAVGYVDRQACTLNYPGDGPFREDAPSWCRAPFEPEGLLSNHLWHYWDPLWARLDSLQGSFGEAKTLDLNGACVTHHSHNPSLHRCFSYVCFTAGAAGIVFSGFYILIDVLGLRTPFLFLEWIGMNAMLVFVMAAQGIFAAFVNGWYTGSRSMSLTMSGTPREWEP
ncbi:hypothetical protein V8G54_019349 [Vigna mungo]|uniref:Heparan-alpha-glucosaminide N-acetyltransferase catalytic domain-containing protein n=1 Tax=Vigna mungo TaxID=3915 RepID=A0AAQ3RUW4_VIGMU